MKQTAKYVLLGLTAFIFVAEPSIAQKKPTTKKTVSTALKTEGTPIPNDPNVKIGKLANGLTYYIRKNTEPKNRAELYLANKIGSLMENDEQQGLAHFTEHMAFNGTKDFPKNEIINYLQKAGVRFGADLNAYTGFNETVYMLPIPTDSAALFHNGFKILANWAGKITMDGEEIDRERGVIIEEDRQRGKNAQERMSKQLLPLLLNNSRYANRLPIGKTDILNSFTHDKIKNFYADWYRPNLQAVIAVGDFDVNEVEKLIKDNFSELKNPAKPKERLSYDLPDNKEPLAKVITDAEQPYNIALVIYKQRGNTLKSTADFKKSIMYSMINSMLGTRFQEILQKGDAPFLFAQSTFGPYQGGLVPGINAFQTVTAAKSAADLEKAITAAVAENERMARFGFVQAELEVVKKNLAANNDKRLKEKDKTASNAFVQQYLANFLTGTSIPSMEFAHAQTIKALESITLADVNALAKTLITKENQIVVVQAPEKTKAELPTEAQILTALKNAGTGVTAYVDNSVNKPLLEKKPVAGKVTAEKKIDAIGVTEWTLSNGVKVLLKPTDFKNDQILFTSFSKGGTSLAPENDFYSADMVSIIPQSGVGAFNPTQLDKLLAGNTGRAGAYVDALYQGFNGNSSPKDLETALQLVYAYATNPRKDAEIFNRSLSEYKVVIANKNASPTSLFADTVQAVLASYNKREMPASLADLEKVSLDKAFAFYKDRFADANEQTFVFVGNFDANTIKPLIETYIGGLPSLNKPKNFVDTGVRPPKGKVSKTVYKGLEDKATVELFIHGVFEYTAENNVQLDALKSALEIKILERLREKESGVYSPQVGLSVSKYPASHYYFNISFSCATANVEKLIAAALDEVKKIKGSGASAEDISKFKSEEQRQMELSLRNNGYWLSYLALRAKYGDDMTLLLNDKKRLEAVTVESTKANANKYLDENNFIRLVLMPEKK